MASELLWKRYCQFSLLHIPVLNVMQGMPTGEKHGVQFNFLPGYPNNTSCLEEAGTRSADAVIIGPSDDLSDKEVCLNDRP